MKSGSSDNASEFEVVPFSSSIHSEVGLKVCMAIRFLHNFHVYRDIITHSIQCDIEQKMHYIQAFTHTICLVL